MRFFKVSADNEDVWVAAFDVPACLEVLHRYLGVRPLPLPIMVEEVSEASAPPRTQWVT